MKYLFRLFGYRLLKNNKYNYLMEVVSSNAFEFVMLLGKIKENREAYESFKISKSQFLQDVFVLCCLNFKRRGYFIEFGAAAGIRSSNTYILEKNYNWGGILVEPSKSFHKNLEKNRGAIIDYRCVHNTSGSKVRFNQTKIGQLSTIDSYSNNDKWKNDRINGKRYEVETITLEDLLDEYESPKIIDYLSIDTEGSELDILKCFNFNKYMFKIITVEHNHVLNTRREINKLLGSHGYKRVLMSISKVDDWYINTNLDGDFLKLL